MDLKSLTEAEFLSTYTLVEAEDDAFPKMSFLADMWDQGTECPLPTHPGYAVAPLTTAEPLGHDVALLHQRSDGSYGAVGLYCGETLAVAEDHQGKGLGTELILAAVLHRPVPEKRTVSSAGLAALKKAWRVAQTR